MQDEKFLRLLDNFVIFCVMSYTNHYLIFIAMKPTYIPNYRINSLFKLCVANEKKKKNLQLRNLLKKTYLTIIFTYKVGKIICIWIFASY